MFGFYSVVQMFMKLGIHPTDAASTAAVSNPFFIAFLVCTILLCPISFSAFVNVEKNGSNETDATEGEYHSIHRSF